MKALIAPKRSEYAAVTTKIVAKSKRRGAEYSPEVPAGSNNHFRNLADIESQIDESQTDEPSCVPRLSIVPGVAAQIRRLPPLLWRQRC
jgi:hypothetical protein